MVTYPGSSSRSVFYIIPVNDLIIKDTIDSKNVK